jgi:quercetin dioxygenase-like cupin family protein
MITLPRCLRMATLLPLSMLPFAASTNAAESATDTAILGSHIYRFEDLAVKPSGVGERRDVADQRTATLDRFECHLSTLNPGLPSHPPHQHPQEELIVLKEGTLEVHINGKTQRVGPGSLFFFASYDWHAVRNVGDVPAKYSVFNFATPITRALPVKPAAEVAKPGQLPSTVFDWEKAEVKTTKTGARRNVVDSPTMTLANLESHVTTLNPGESPHPVHHHPDEEIVLIKEGSVAVTLKGATQTIGPGSIAFFASNDEHTLKNVGTTPASYYILRVVTAATPKTVAAN